MEQFKVVGLNAANRFKTHTCPTPQRNRNPHTPSSACTPVAIEFGPIGFKVTVPKHPASAAIQFVVFNAEEQGLVGSRAYVRNLVDSGRFVVYGAFNLDMVAYDYDGDRRIQLQTDGTVGSNYLAQAMADSMRTYRLDLQPVRVVDDERSSDYASFWSLGLPAINIGDEYFFCDSDFTSPHRRAVHPPEGDFDPCYHNTCDVTTSEGFRVSMIVEVAKALIGGVGRVAVTAP